jgi:para-nitrobenzyl esterase
MQVKERKFLSVILMFLLMSTIMVNFISANEHESDNEIIVDVASGLIRGKQSSGVNTFLGVPYGAPTGGENRWLPPKPVEPWVGVLDAFELPPVAPQRFTGGMFTEAVSISNELFDVFTGGSDFFDVQTQSEDCLKLNIWAPAQVNEFVPVLVWLHGGAWEVGSGNSPGNNGFNIAKTGDAIVVNVNHRLGIMGFLYLADLTDDDRYAYSGNIMMLDLIAALEWIQENISAFGGDPNRVMIFGYSGGGWKVSTLLAIPRAQGLFHAAAAQSGAAFAVTPESANNFTNIILDELGLTDSKDVIADLQRIDANELVLAVNRANVVIGLGPVIDNRVLFAQINDAIAGGSAKNVSLIVGSTREEFSLFVSGDPDFGNIDDETLAQKLGPLGILLPLYKERYPYIDNTMECYNTMIWSRIMSDISFVVPGISLAQAHAQGSQGAPTFMYNFQWVSSVIPQYGAPHGIDESLFFNNVQLSRARREGIGGPELGEMLSRMWIQFASTGNPNLQGLPYWPKFTLDEMETLIIDYPTFSVSYADPHTPVSPIRWLMVVLFVLIIAGLVYMACKKPQHCRLIIIVMCIIAIFAYFLPSINLGISFRGLSSNSALSLTTIFDSSNNPFSGLDMSGGEDELMPVDISEIMGTIIVRLVLPIIAYTATLIMLIITLIYTILNKFNLARTVMFCISIVIYFIAGLTITGTPQSLSDSMAGILGPFANFLNISQMFNITLGMGFWLTIITLGGLIFTVMMAKFNFKNPLTVKKENTN